MRNQIINILVVVISIALIGLIGIQLYWINNAVALKEDEFQKKVNTALNDVVKTLERNELINKIKASSTGRRILQKKLTGMKLRSVGAQKMTRGFPVLTGFVRYFGAA